MGQGQAGHSVLSATETAQVKRVRETEACLGPLWLVLASSPVDFNLCGACWTPVQGQVVTEPMADADRGSPVMTIVFLFCLLQEYVNTRVSLSSLNPPPPGPSTAGSLSPWD